MIPGITAGQMRQPATSGAPVVLDSYSGTLATSASSHSVPLPSTVAADDLLLLGITARGSGSTSVPAGWTLRVGSVNASISPNCRLMLCSLDAAGTEGGTSVTVTLPTASPITYAVLRIKAGTFDKTHALFRNKIALINSSSAASAVPASNTYPGFPVMNSLAVSCMGAYAVVGGGFSGYSFADNHQERREGSTTSTASAIEVSSATNAESGASPVAWPEVALSASMSHSRAMLVLRGAGAPTEPEAAYVTGASLATAFNSLNITLSASAEVGDTLMLACMSPVASSASLSGWTVHAGTGVNFLTKVAASGDIGATKTVTFGASAKHYILHYVIRANSLTTSSAQSVAASASSTTPTTSAITVAALANKKVMAFECVRMGTPGAVALFTASNVDREAFFDVFNNSVDGVRLTIGFKIYTADASGSIPAGSYTLSTSKDWGSLRLVMG